MTRSLFKALLCFAALLGLSLPAAGCAASPERCPDGQAVVAQFTAGPPSHLGARCSGDAAGVERRSVDGDARGVFEVVCPEGSLPGPSAETVKQSACSSGTCTQAEIVCLPTTTAEQPGSSTQAALPAALSQSLSDSGPGVPPPLSWGCIRDLPPDVSAGLPASGPAGRGV